MTNALSNSTLYERNPCFYVPIFADKLQPIFHRRITCSTTLTLQNMHRRAEAYQIKQLLYRNSFSCIFLAFYALHFFPTKTEGKILERDKYSYKRQPDSLAKSCFHLCFCYLVVSKTFLVEKPLQNLQNFFFMGP